MASKNIKNLTTTQKVGSIICALTLSATLVGCSNSEPKEETETTITTEETQNEQSQEVVEQETSTTEEASTAVEEAITIMIEGAEDLSQASEEAKQTESYQEVKEVTMQNFDDLFGFLFLNEEIAGYTIEEVGDSTVEFGTDALLSLDSYIEQYIPEYKDNAQEKLQEAGIWIEDKVTDLAAWGYNEYQELKEKTLEKINNQK